MKSVYIPVRLTTEEAQKLDSMIAGNDTTGFENKGEFFRLLLHREFNRCHGLPKPKDSDWRSVHRIGAKKKVA